MRSSLFCARSQSAQQPQRYMRERRLMQLRRCEQANRKGDSRAVSGRSQLRAHLSRMSAVAAWQEARVAWRGVAMCLARTVLVLPAYLCRNSALNYWAE
eukprot:6177039-Pleurochrysis_carterae.AAC.1